MNEIRGSLPAMACWLKLRTAIVIDSARTGLGDKRVPPLLEMKNPMQRIRCKLNQTPLNPMSILFVIKINRTSKNSSSGANLYITVVVCLLAEGMIAVILQQSTNQNTVSVIERHNKPLFN